MLILHHFLYPYVSLMAVHTQCFMSLLTSVHRFSHSDSFIGIQSIHQESIEEKLQAKFSYTHTKEITVHTEPG